MAEETILVVEDNDGLRALAQRSLGREGYKVIAASSGEDALQLCAPDVPIDLLVTDRVMPGMDGRTLAGRLSGARPMLKVLYMSGYAEDAIVQAALAEHASFLQKPFEPSELARRVRELLDAPDSRLAEPSGRDTGPVGEQRRIG